MQMKKKIGLIVLSLMLILTILNLAPQGDATTINAKIDFQNEVSLSATPATPPPSMIAYWELNEGVGTTVTDTIVPYITGHTFNNPSWVPGVARSGLQILESQYIDFGRPSYLYLPEVLTLEAWINLPDPSGLHTIIMNAYSSSNIQYHFGIQDGHLYFDRQAGIPGNYVTSSAAITPGQWHHVVVVMNWGLRSVWFYIDGVDETIYPYNDDYTGPSGEVTIGADRATGAPSYLRGMIDEVAVYNDMLDQSIIQEHYLKGLHGLGYLDELPSNTPPVAVDDEYSMFQDSTLLLGPPGVLENDVDEDGDPLSAEIFSVPSFGFLDLYADGSLSYSPLPGFVGFDTFEYRAFDGIDYSTPAVVMINIEVANTPPVAQDDSYSTDEDVPLVVSGPGVLSNDHDSQPSNILSVELVDNVDHGTLILSAAGSFEYTPVPDWYGTDTFSYRVYDGFVFGNEAMVTIIVNPVNDPPIAYDAAFVGNEDVILYNTLPSGFDVDEDSLEYIVTTDPVHGTLILDPFTGAFSYTPLADWFGVDLFEYQLGDGELGSNIAVVMIEILQDDDITGPVITILYTGGATDGSSGYWDVYVADPESGISSILVEIDGVFAGTSVGTYPVPNSLGDHIITVTAVNDDTNNGDNDQESSTLSHTVTIVDDDVTAPIIDITYTGDMTDNNPGFWTVVVNDPESGVYSILVEIDGVSVGTAEGVFAVPGTLGFHSITVTAVNYDMDRLDDQETSSHSAVVLIEGTTLPTALTYLGDLEGVYSDPIYLEALLIDATTGMPLSGKIIQFSLGSQSATALTDTDGLASICILLDQESGIYQLVVSYAGDNDYLPSESVHEFALYKENASVIYSGVTLKEVSDNEFTLQASIFDDEDGNWGDLSLAYVTFSIYLSSDPLTPIHITSPIRVQPLDIDGVGVVTSQIPSLPEGEYLIIVHLLPEHNRFYCSLPTDPVTVTIYEPERDHAHGAGRILDSDGHRAYFLFNAKYSCKGKLIGFLLFIYVDGDWGYLVSARDIMSFTTDGNHGYFEANCTLTKFNFKTHVSSEEWCRARVDVFDNKKNRERDVFQIRIYNGLGQVETEAGFDPVGHLLNGCIVVKHGKRH